MKKDFKSLLIIFALCFISLISVISFVSGLGISSSYHSKNPLIMAPGESMDIIFGRFQNVVGDYDMVIGVELLGGEEIAEITDSSLEYSVPLGRKDIAVHMNVSIPKRDFEDSYTITIRYRELNPPTGEGTVSLAAASQKTINVLVQKEEKKIIEEIKEIGIIGIVLIISLILIIIVIVIIIFIRKKNKKSLGIRKSLESKK